MRSRASTGEDSGAIRGGFVIVRWSGCDLDRR